MKFSEMVTQAVAWLQREERVSYRALKREFALQDDALDDLKEELVTIKELAVDKDGKMLVWVGNAASSVQSQGSRKGRKQSEVKVKNRRTAVTYTPPHSSRAHPRDLAER